MTGRRICLIGEGMVELRQEADGTCRLGYGGDTLNTAIHMARHGCGVVYATALGEDSFSRQLRTAWALEGLDCSAILTDPKRGAGLYAITLDGAGERTFTYWRSDSAARQLFALSGSNTLAQSARDAGALAFSLISLAILGDEGRAALVSLAQSIRNQGGLVAFDGNYRPHLWEDAASAAHWRDRAIAVSSIGLPTLDDEVAMTGEASVDEVAAHWESLGCAETVVKMGAQGCRLPGGEIVGPSARLDPVDTSGAGDAFNGGYLAARLKGESPLDAAREGNALAGWTIMRAGAIPQRDDAAPYRVTA
jgi:2-dehydro-3-deoxygluconokinase